MRNRSTNDLGEFSSLSHSLALLAALALSPLLAASALEADQAAAAPRPNIIVVFVDDLGYGDLSAFGSSLIDTPNIDRLGAEGVIMTNWYSASNVCTPSRAALLTGRYAPRSGMQHVTRPHSTWGMPPGEITIAEMLKETGYSTGMIGKWHLGHRLEFWPTSQGFDSFFGVAYSNDMVPFDLYRGTERIEEDIDQANLSDQYTTEALRFIGENAGQPFFLYYAHSHPHYPAVPAPRHAGRSRAGDYGDTVATIDDSVGRILAVLDDHGIADNTLILFTSDNGPWFQGSSGPLRARKGETYEGGYHVPFLARWPAQIPAGLVIDEMAMTIDLLPTFARLAGAEVPADRAIDGRDITDMWIRGTSSPHDVLYFFDANDLAAVRDDRFKLVLKTYYRNGSIPFRRFSGPKLFDLAADPGENYDVGNRHPEEFERLMTLAEAMEAITDPLATTAETLGGADGAPLGPQLDP